jgi:hypothetical protein
MNLFVLFVQSYLLLVLKMLNCQRATISSVKMAATPNEMGSQSFNGPLSG